MIDAQRHLQNVHEGIHRVSGIVDTGPALETPVPDSPPIALLTSSTFYMKFTSMKYRDEML